MFIRVRKSKDRDHEMSNPESTDDPSLARTVALVSLASFYMYQINYLETHGLGRNVIPTHARKLAHIVNELQKIVDIPYLNENPLEI